ncbi:MAG: hypothetical protein WDA07_06300 [Leucobacter sp.]
MDGDRMIVRVQRQIWGEREIAIHFGFRERDAYMAIAEPLVFRSISPGTIADKPAVALTREEAQLLMDELWTAGLRPTEGNGSAGALAAVQAHLQDMRRIALQEIPSLADNPKG